TDSIHKAFPYSEVSFAGPAVNWGQDWDLLGLANSCDYIFIMGYAFNGKWSKNTAPNSPLKGTTFCITNTIETQYVAVTNTKPEKLILGLPYYGYHWKTETPEENANVIQAISSTRFKNDEVNIQTYGLQWSIKYSNSWYRWNDGEWHQVWYDNDSSLGLKYDLAINKNLRGVGMWALCYDGGRQELWNLIEGKFNNSSIIFYQEQNMPDNFFILPNYPNPFNPFTQICFNINEPGKIIVEIFSTIGTLVKSFEEKFSSAGQYKIMWNGKNHSDELISSGCYFYRITFTNNEGIVKQKSSKMILLK
ncbi:MAG: T9SS type A sorting domain-containing protein, partial [Ignavibacteriales bacterium]|nr:T9SS type A sorting domain-containing protein [Ignavibacteriales bacterium]